MLLENPEFLDVRIVTIHGQPWFVGKDICRLFGDKNHNRSLSRVEDEDKRMVSLETKGGTQRMTAINEPGLNALLMCMCPQRANKNGVHNAYPPHMEARIEKLKAFRRWLTHEVLPALRKDGRYMTPEAQARIAAEAKRRLAEFKAMQAKRHDEIVIEDS